MSVKPDKGLDPRTLRSWPESKSRVGCLTDWATQVSFTFFLFLFYSKIALLFFFFFNCCLFSSCITGQSIESPHIVIKITSPCNTGPSSLLQVIIFPFSVNGKYTKWFLQVCPVTLKLRNQCDSGYWVGAFYCKNKTKQKQKQTNKKTPKFNIHNKKKTKKYFL